MLYPEQDASCATAIEAYRPHLRPGANHTLIEWPLSKVVELWVDQLETSDERSWLEALHLRYVELEASLGSWLEAHDLEVIDKRPQKGRLWVVGSDELKAVLRPQGFHHAPKGGAASGYRPAWFLPG